MTKKSNIIPFPKTNIREVKIKDIAEELETQMIKIKEQRELIEGQREDNRPDWEKASDDFMNKFLKFCMLCIFLFGVYKFVIEPIFG